MNSVTSWLIAIGLILAAFAMNFGGRHTPEAAIEPLPTSNRGNDFARSPMTEAPAPHQRDETSTSQQARAPVAITIPALGLAQSTIVPVGRTSDGVMGLQDSAISWYRHGGEPGELGSVTLLATHVAYNGVSGEFGDLASLTSGDEVSLRLSDDQTLDFNVTSLAIVDKSLLENLGELKANSEKAQFLYLLTCGGRFDEASRSYDSYVLVTATIEA